MLYDNALLARAYLHAFLITGEKDFADTARRVGLHPAIERSRSGNGAHVWFFFAAPVLASSARKMGSYLITETMNRRHQLSMRSYDRLFPSQDTLPRGGFGNGLRLGASHRTASPPSSCTSLTGAWLRTFGWK